MSANHCWVYASAMSLPTAYLTSFKNTSDILQAMQAAQAPERFTIKFLEGLGFPSSNDRTIINVLKALGFLDDNGVPTTRYHQYLDQTQSAVVLAQGIRDAYTDLFKVNKTAQNMTTAEVKNKMKTLSVGQFTDRVLTQMSGTFTTLVKLADFSGNAAAGLQEDEPDVEHEDADEEQDNNGGDRSRSHTRFNGLVYNINIHLPESREPAVYDALFKSLKEHLG